MNPTLSAALALLPARIEWHPGYDERTEVYASITIDDIHLRLDIGYSTERQTYRLAANISSHDRPHIRVSWGDRADLCSAWTEVAEVVTRVDAAAGAAMGLPRETKADARRADDVQAALDDHCKRLKAKPGRKCDDCGYTIDDCECGGLRPQTSYG